MVVEIVEDIEFTDTEVEDEEEYPGYDKEVILRFVKFRDRSEYIEHAPLIFQQFENVGKLKQEVTSMFHPNFSVGEVMVQEEIKNNLLVEMQVQYRNWSDPSQIIVYLYRACC